MKTFETPVLDIRTFGVEDILLASPAETEAPTTVWTPPQCPYDTGEFA